MNRFASRRRILQGLLAVGCLPGLVACGGCRGQVTVALHPWIGYEPLVLARAQGGLPDSVRLLEGKTSADSLAALASGQAQAACLTLDEVLVARSRSIPLTVVAVLDISAGADVILGRPGLKGLADLKGRRIGVEASTVGQLMLAMVLAKTGLTPEGVTVVDVAVDQQVAAWKDGRLDAVITYEPVASQLMAQGANPLADSRDFPEMIFDVLAIRHDTLTQCGQASQDLVNAHFRGLAQLQGNLLDSQHRIASHQGIALADVQQALGGIILPDEASNQSLMAASGRIHDAAREISALLQRQGLGAAGADGVPLVDARLLTRAGSER